MREAAQNRETAETSISVYIALDGSGQADINTDVGFFDHMLCHVARHGLFDLRVAADGDLHIDAHHTVEDVGICLGKAFLEALGDRKGIVRYGHAVAPMDEALADVAVDISGRPVLVYDVKLPTASLNGFDAELVEEFLRAFTSHARLTLHVELRRGRNLHHCIEAVFKALGRALDAATRLDERIEGVASTKGMLET
jgi:imidazoleglycerol-phosphate dehydratase